MFVEKSVLKNNVHKNVISYNLSSNKPQNDYVCGNGTAKNMIRHCVSLDKTVSVLYQKAISTSTKVDKQLVVLPYV